MQTLIFGKVNLIPHLVEQEPTEHMMAYVDFGDDTHLVQGIWRGNGWLDRKGKPHLRPVVRWYHLEKEDGSRAF